MRRHESLFLVDIVRAADSVAGFVAGSSEERFLASDLLQSAVAYKLLIIGEAANHLPESVRERHGSVAWSDARALRNVLAHQYFGLTWPVIWRIATRNLPALRDQVDDILRSDYPEALR